MIFLLDEAKPLGIEIVKNNNYPYITHNTHQAESEEANQEAKDEVVEKIEAYGPDIVINDILNTKSKYTKALRDRGYFIVNFEDLGGGIKYAHLIFDALYEHKIPLQNLYSGHNFYITFGGSDPNNFTEKVLESILKSSYENEIEIILGLGYSNKKEIQEKYKDNDRITIYENVKNMSEHMHSADLIFTSAGRTMYEIASLGVPCVCLCQNERELSHIFGNVENGFINLGLGVNITEEQILETLESLLDNYELRCEMSRRMKSIDLKHGFENIARLIKKGYKEWQIEKALKNN